ncbi:hypothetical protein ACI782_05965 [Geodermatophilus sp. SYSU D00703]
MKVDAQVRVLEAFAKHSSAPDGRFVTSDAISSTVKDVSHHSFPLSNAFFVDAKWLVKQGRGEYAATEALLNYRRRAALNADDPRAKQALRESMTEAWFWTPIKNQLQFGGAEEADVLHNLMLEAGATPEHKSQLKNLVEWVKWVGLIRDEGERLVLVGDGGEAEPRMEDSEDKATLGEQASNGRGSDDRRSDAPGDTDSRRQPPLPDTTPRAVPILAFDFSFQLTAEELTKLSPEQIQALFAAVGNVMSIRANVAK